jgi:hypothetical protein
MKKTTTDYQNIASERQQAQEEENALRMQAAAERGLSVPQSLRKIVLPQFQGMLQRRVRVEKLTGRFIVSYLKNLHTLIVCW